MTGLEALDPLPLVAILRGATADEVPALVEALYGAGWRAFEVPLSGPGSLEAVATLVRAAPPDTLVGAGTVRTREQLFAVRDVGGRLVVSPDVQPALVEEAAHLGLVAMPGVATPSEAFRALDAGAPLLKLFPGESLPPAVVRAWRAVLPDARLYPVGGVTLDTFPAWLRAGASGFGVGSAIYRPQDPAPDVATRARAWVEAWARATAG